MQIFSDDVYIYLIPLLSTPADFEIYGLDLLQEAITYEFNKFIIHGNSISKKWEMTYTRKGTKRCGNRKSISVMSCTASLYDKKFLNSFLPVSSTVYNILQQLTWEIYVYKSGEGLQQY